MFSDFVFKSFVKLHKSYSYINDWNVAVLHFIKFSVYQYSILNCQITFENVEAKSKAMLNFLSDIKHADNLF